MSDDLLRQKLIKALTNNTLSAEAAEVEDDVVLEEPAPDCFELLTAEGLPPDPADERARVAASVAAVLLAHQG